MSRTGLTTAAGRQVVLGAEVGTGGEGRVYSVVGAQDVVAKIYHSTIDPKKALKLQAMVSSGTPELLKIAAWPTDVLLDPARRVVGLLMPRVTAAREAHCVYSPKQRRQIYPTADWKFLVWVARNAAAAVATVHEAGHVIGDINQKGFLVDAKATVRLIDCDSFQVSVGSERHLCLVGVPEFTAPELIGKPFDRTLRTPNHDAFGLATLIFHLLFMGRHPFAGRFTGGAEMPVDRAVREFRFAYSAQASSYQMTPPPHSLPLHAASAPIAMLFEQAFGRAGSQMGRPTAAHWLAALETLASELKACAVDKSHRFHTSMKACSWCELERMGAPSFFVPAISAGPGATFNLEDFLRVVRALNLPPMPPAPPSIAVPHFDPRPIPVKSRLRDLVVRGAGWCSAVLFVAMLAGLQAPASILTMFTCGAVAILLSRADSASAERSKRRDLLAGATRRWDQLVNSWQQETSAALRDFHAMVENAVRLAGEYQGLPAQRVAGIKQLEAAREKSQRVAFLDRFDVETATLPGIGAGLKAALIAESFETAADITAAVNQVAGIGPARYQTLLNWRRSLEARFRFNPAMGVAPSDIAALDQRLYRRRADLVRQLNQARAEVNAKHRRASALLAPDKRIFEEAALALARAKADAAL